MPRTLARPRMSPAQAAYLAAKAAYDLAYQRYDARVEAEIPTPATDEEYETAGDAADQLAAECRIDALASALKAAEDALLAWGHNGVKHLPGYATNSVEIEKLYSSRTLAVRRRLIDLTMRLKVSR